MNQFSLSGIIIQTSIVNILKINMHARYYFQKLLLSSFVSKYVGGNLYLVDDYSTGNDAEWKVAFQR